jgi:hypothetical protein
MNVPNKKNIGLWNKLVNEVFNHPKSKYSIFVYELVKRRVLGKDGKEYKATLRSDKKFKINNIK